MSAEQVLPSPLLALISLGQKARQVSSWDELGFLLVNDSKELSGYRQALLWTEERGITHLSGVVLPERHSPFMQWANALCQHLAAKPVLAYQTLTVQDCAADLQSDWARWLPDYIWWMPVHLGKAQAALLIAADSLDEQYMPLWREWLAIWQHATHNVLRAQSAPLIGTLQRWFGQQKGGSSAWYRSYIVWAMFALIGISMLPVRLTVVGQGELVPRQAVVVRAPLDGVIHEFHVSPNQIVQASQPLFAYDNEVIRSRLQVARQTLATAQAEYRQVAQSALHDPKASFQMAGLVGKIQEKQAEYRFLTDQVARTTVTAPQAGVVLFDEASEWIGKPVQTGERVVRIADPSDVELEIWVNLADAVPLTVGSDAKLFLAANPLEALEATVRWVGYEAQARPDGTFAYRVRASLTHSSSQTVGAKGTARLSSERVTLMYWLLRKPLAVVRGYLLL